MSPLIELQCKNCGAPLERKGQQLECPYCNSRFSAEGLPVEGKDPSIGGKYAPGDPLVTDGIKAYNNGEYLTAVINLLRGLEMGIKVNRPADTWTILGNAYMELQKYPEALDAHQHALDIDAQFHKAWVNMGIVHRKMGDLDRAEQCYRKAMEIKPNYAELHTSLGALYIHRDQPEKAIPELQEAIRLDPTVAVTYGNLALAYAMVGRFAEAEKALKTSVVKGYKNHQLVKDRIEALKKIG